MFVLPEEWQSFCCSNSLGFLLLESLPWSGIGNSCQSPAQSRRTSKLEGFL